MTEYHMSVAPSHEVIGLFTDYVGNNERKTLLGAIVLADSTRDFDPGSLSHEYKSHQDEGNVWRLSRRDCGNLITSNLVPGGVVEEVGLVGEYRVCTGQSEMLASAAATFMRWGLEYSDVSVQQILGLSGSPSSVRSPCARLHIYGHLLHNEKVRLIDLMGIHEVTGHKTPQCVASQIEKMEDLGIVDIEIPSEQNPLLQIVRSMPNSRMQESNQLIRDLCMSLAEGTQLTLDDFLHRFRHRLSSAGQVELRRDILGNVQSHGRYAHLALVDEAVNTKTSVVSLKEEVKIPIEDLYTSLEQLAQRGPTAKLINLTRSIIEEPRSKRFRVLLAKGRTFSAVANSDSAEALSQKIVSLMPADRKAQMTVREMRKLLQDTYDKSISVIALRQKMNAMTDGELLKRDQVEVASRVIDSPFATHDQRWTNVYRLGVAALEKKKGK